MFDIRCWISFLFNSSAPPNPCGASGFLNLFVVTALVTANKSAHSISASSALRLQFADDEPKRERPDGNERGG